MNVNKSTKERGRGYSFLVPQSIKKKGDKIKKEKKCLYREKEIKGVRERQGEER